MLDGYGNRLILTKYDKRLKRIKKELIVNDILANNLTANNVQNNLTEVKVHLEINDVNQNDLRLDKTLVKTTPNLGCLQMNNNIASTITFVLIVVIQDIARTNAPILSIQIV